MARWAGVVGYVTQTEVVAGVHQEVTTERSYKGDVYRRRRNLSGSDQVNDNVTLSDEISIVADPYAIQNYLDIRYVVRYGHKFKVTGVSVEYPRLLLTLGGPYNAYETST